MSTSINPPPVQQPPTSRPPKLVRRWLYAVGAAVVALGAGIGIGAAAASSTTTTTVVKTVAGPTVTKIVPMPGPVHTVYRVKDVPVPGPTQYKTQYVPASQGPTGTTIATYSGTGNQVTGSFTVPASGDYIVKWSYSGNTDPTIGGGANFSISDTNSSGMAGNEPNDIAASGSGSTEDTGMSGSQSFNVQATGQWMITVISAS